MVNGMGVVLNSVAVMVNSVLLTTANTKYLIPSSMPPNTLPVNSMLRSEYIPAVLLQVIRLVVAEVAVQVTDSMGSDEAKRVC